MPRQITIYRNAESNRYAHSIFSMQHPGTVGLNNWKKQHAAAPGGGEAACCHLLGGGGDLRDVDGVAADPVQGVQHLAEHDAGVHAAFAQPQAVHVVLLGLLGLLAVFPLQLGQPLQLVDADVLGIEPGGGFGIELFHIAVDLLQLRQGGFGIHQILFGAALVHMEQMLGVVADPLQVAEGLEDAVDIGGVLLGQLLDVELHQIVADGIGEEVDDGFVVGDGLGVQDLVFEDALHGQVDILGHQPGHPVNLGADLQHGDAGVAHQVDVDVLQSGGVLVLLLGNQLVGQPDHQLRGGQQQGGGHHLEDDVDHGDLERGTGHQALNELGIGQQQRDGGHDDGAHHVVDQVDHGGPLGVVPGAHGGQNGGHGGADVDARHQERGKVQRHQSLHGQRLENTDGGGGTLDHGAQQRAHQNAQNGVLGVHDELLEPDHILQRLHGAGHGVQALEQQTEAQDDLADVLILGLLGIEHQEGADEHAERRNAGDIQSNQDGGDGGTDVGAEDDAGGLGQVHNAGVDEAHNHDGGGGGGLNDHGNQRAQQEAQDGVAGQLFQQVLHLGTGCLLQALAHVLHTEQERAQSAQQGNDVGYTHEYSSRIVLISSNPQILP